MSYNHLDYVTKGDSLPNGKTRVFYCSHHNDFDKFFQTIANDIFLCQTKVTIWYLSPTASEMLTESDFSAFESDLSQMQLFVVPVTRNLLFSENRVLTHDIPFAIANRIPLLPIMMEPGLEYDFNAKCGNFQCLSRIQHDSTELPYQEKLNGFLEKIIVGSEFTDKIKNAFDAYIFLSYRKKDRKYAQKLMQLIHSNDFCRDVAIWYDEFLSPGDDFNDAILKALGKSQLFALVITPNLLEKGNYVLTTEYPIAVRDKKNILSMEMDSTNAEDFYNLYQEINQYIKMDDYDSLRTALKTMLKTAINNKQNNSPQHLFFIGLAYFSGLDLEVNREKGIELIEAAADKGLPEAAEKLADIYLATEGQLSLTALKWMKKYAILCKKHYGICSRYYNSMDRLARMYTICGQFEKADSTIDNLLNIVVSFSTESVETFCEIRKKYVALCVDFITVHPEFTNKYRHRAENISLDILKDRKKYEKQSDDARYHFLLAKLECLFLRLDPETLLNLDDDKNIYDKIFGNDDVAFMEINEKSRRIEIYFTKQIIDECRKKFAPDCALCLQAMDFLAARYSENLNDFDKAQNALRELLEWHNKYGECNDCSIFNLSRRLALLCRQKGKYAQASQILENDLEKLSNILGHNSPFVLRCKLDLADTQRIWAYKYRKDPNNASLVREKRKKSQSLILDVLEDAILTMGETHPDVMMIVKGAKSFFTDCPNRKKKKFLDELKFRIYHKKQLLYPEEQIKSIDAAAYSIKTAFFFEHKDKAEYLYQKYISNSVSSEQIIDTDQKNLFLEITVDSVIVIKKVSDHYYREGKIEEYVKSRLAFCLLMHSMIKDKINEEEWKKYPFHKKYLLRELKRMIRKMHSIKKHDYALFIEKYLNLISKD